MTDTTAAAAEPTAEELAAATAIFDRKRAADTAKLAALAPKVQAIADTEGFAKILADATALRTEVGEGGPFYAHLNAIVVGMECVLNDLKVVEAPAAPAAA